MQLEKLPTGQLKAHKTAIDVIHYLDNLNEFQVSERVTTLLREYPKFLADNYWYLAIGSYEELQEGEKPTQFEWEITVNTSEPQIPIRGIVEFVDGFPILA